MFCLLVFRGGKERVRWRNGGLGGGTKEGRGLGGEGRRTEWRRGLGGGGGMIRN